MRAAKIYILIGDQKIYFLGHKTTLEVNILCKFLKKVMKTIFSTRHIYDDEFCQKIYKLYLKYRLLHQKKREQHIIFLNKEPAPPCRCPQSKHCNSMAHLTQ